MAIFLVDGVNLFSHSSMMLLHFPPCPLRSLIFFEWASLGVTLGVYFGHSSKSFQPVALLHLLIADSNKHVALRCHRWMDNLKEDARDRLPQAHVCARERHGH